jgi:diacylglycerol kinase family enzyme
VIKSLNFSHSHGRLSAEEIELEGTAVMAAVCNGRQAGGGQILAPFSYINDGLLDVIVVLAFPIINVGQVIQEVLSTCSNGQYVKRFQSKWLESWPDQIRSINLDGEPYQSDHIRFDVLHNEIKLVVPKDCPCLQ